MPTKPAQGPCTVLLAPIDQGVRNVGGRDGTREGPARLLAALEDAGYLPADARVTTVEVTNTAESLEADLHALSDAVRGTLEAGRTPVVLGGDHGTTYATVRGASRALDGIGVVYLDVHFDLRGWAPEHTSGSSFRRLVEEGIVPAERVRPIGIETPRTAQARQRSDYDRLEAYAEAQGIPWVGLDEARERGPGAIVDATLDTAPWCVSLDTDAIDQRWAPGVSAPGEGRFSPDQADAFLDAAAKHAAVFDVVEYAPPLDEEDRTLDTLVELVGPMLDRLG